MKPIGVASRESGVGIEAIRYYEREGIVPPASRAENGRRHYSDQEISRLRFVRKCRNLGFSMAEIKSLQALSGSSDNPCVEAAEIGARNLRNVRQKIVELQQMECALEALVSECRRRPEKCPMLEGLMSG